MAVEAGVSHPRFLRPAARLTGTVRVPSDKSIAQRALIFSALAAGTARISLRAPGDDVVSAADALRALGASVQQAPERAGRNGTVVLTVTGTGDRSGIGRLAGEADCGNSGTAMRLLAGALAASPASSVLTGDASLSRRPMERVVTPLRQMGARLGTSKGHAPIAIVGSRPLRALRHELSVPSAQVLGAIAIAALAAEGQTSIVLPGPTRDHSERMLRLMDARVKRDDLDGGGTRTTIEGPAVLDARSMVVPGDISSAAAWVAAATLHPNAQLLLPGVGLNPSRSAFLDVLREMGADIQIRPNTEDEGGEPAGDGEPAADVIVRSASGLRAVSIAGDRAAEMIDELPLLAVAMAAAERASEVRGAAELRVKESDRIAAMAAALDAAGAQVEELPDGWRIRRGRPERALVTTYGDHRIGMAMAVAAWTGVAREVVLDDPACVAVSYPDFWQHAADLGAAGSAARGSIPAGADVGRTGA